MTRPLTQQTDGIGRAVSGGGGGRRNHRQAQPPGLRPMQPRRTPQPVGGGPAVAPSSASMGAVANSAEVSAAASLLLGDASGGDGTALDRACALLLSHSDALFGGDDNGNAERGGGASTAAEAATGDVKGDPPEPPPRLPQVDQLHSLYQKCRSACTVIARAEEAGAVIGGGGDALPPAPALFKHGQHHNQFSPYPSSSVGRTVSSASMLKSQPPTLPISGQLTSSSSTSSMPRVTSSLPPAPSAYKRSAAIHARRKGGGGPNAASAQHLIRRTSSRDVGRGGGGGKESSSSSSSPAPPPSVLAFLSALNKSKGGADPGTAPGTSEGAGGKDVKASDDFADAPPSGKDGAEAESAPPSPSVLSPPPARKRGRPRTSPPPPSSSAPSSPTKVLPMTPTRKKLRSSGGSEEKLPSPPFQKAGGDSDDGDASEETKPQQPCNPPQGGLSAGCDSDSGSESVSEEEKDSSPQISAKRKRNESVDKGEEEPQGSQISARTRRSARRGGGTTGDGEGGALDRTFDIGEGVLVNVKEGRKKTRRVGIVRNIDFGTGSAIKITYEVEFDDGTIMIDIEPADVIECDV